MLNIDTTLIAPSFFCAALLFLFWVAVLKPYLTQVRASKLQRKRLQTAEKGRALHTRTRHYNKCLIVRDEMIENNEDPELIALIDANLAIYKKEGVYSHSQEITFIKSTLRSLLSPI